MWASGWTATATGLILLRRDGGVADGDQIMALCAGRWAEEGRLKGGTLAATVMSNLGLEAVSGRPRGRAAPHARGRPPGEKKKKNPQKKQ